MSEEVKKPIERADSKKVSYWWDNHVSAKNSKWLIEHLEGMDKHTQQMMKLIQDDGDSFAQKVEMYYKKRPELISHVQEYQHMYQSLAERYTHLIGEVRKNVTPDRVMQSPRASSGASVDLGSESSSSWLTPEAKLNRFKSTHRAAGFDFFLGHGATSSSDRFPRGDDSSLISDSEETESDISSVYNYPRLSENTSEEALHEKGMQLEVADFSDNRDKKVSTLYHDENHSDISFKNGIGSKTYLELQSKIAEYEDEVANLKMELEQARSLNAIHFPSEAQLQAAELEEDSNNVEETEVGSDAAQRIRSLIEEIRVYKRRVYALESQVTNLTTEKRSYHENIHRLQEQLKMAQKDTVAWKTKSETEMRKASKWQDRIARYKASLTDRDTEIRELKDVISDVNKKYQLHAEITRLADENTKLQENLREWEVRCQLLESQQSVVEKKHNDEIGHLQVDLSEKITQLEAVNEELDTLKLKYDALMGERDKLSAKVAALNSDATNSSSLSCNDNGDGFDDLKSRVEQLREEVERQKVLILEGAEEKREVIRQLCFSLEHYRIGYEQLRQAFNGNKQHAAVFVS